jgi:hypothetical protein
MKRLLVVLVILSYFIDGSAQSSSKKDVSKVRLLRWSVADCDNTYDPYRLMNRITSFETKDGITFITVNFSDNCCPEFKPIIDFKDNKLMLFPYKEFNGEYCSCDCCFSINFEIEGIAQVDYEVYFKDKKIELSEDHYKTVNPTSETYNGTQINRVNKYGFREGTWIKFYESGKQKSITKYPETSIYYEPRPEWSKRFSEAGKLTDFNRKDSIESWFEDGELKYQTINYAVGDTIFEKSFSLYDNRKIQEKYLERRYPTIFTSEFDPTYKGTGSRWDYVYKEQYFANGQPKYLQGKDTTYTWFENGRIAIKNFDSKVLEYNEQGLLIKRSFRWKEPGVPSWGDLDYSLYFEYRANGDLQKIHFVRDELSKDRQSLSPNVHYEWEWDENLKLIDSPNKWKEEYPWEKIIEIKQLPKKYPLH